MWLFMLFSFVSFLDFEIGWGVFFCFLGFLVCFFRGGGGCIRHGKNEKNVKFHGIGSRSHEWSILFQIFLVTYTYFWVKHYMQRVIELISVNIGTIKLLVSCIFWPTCANVQFVINLYVKHPRDGLKYLGYRVNL